MGGYALDMTSPIRHVATELERVAPAALSLGELADTYNHPNHADLVRVRQHEGCETDRDAVLWLMNQAIEKIERRGKAGAVQIVADNGGFRFADGMTFEDLRYNGKALHRERDDHARLGDPFNPMSGWASANVRLGPDRDNLDELKDSMRTFGWVPEFPALRDKRTQVVLVGHRRLKAAAELRAEGVEIQDMYRDLDIGDGDEADARRLSIAIASNLGGRPLTPENRKRIAKHLYGEPDWSQQRIAEALQVDQKTISSDLRELGVAPKSKRGRPRGSTSQKKAPPELDQEVLERRAAGDSVPRKELAEKYGVGEQRVQQADAKATGALEERERQEERRRFDPGIREVTPGGDICVCPTCGHTHQR